MQSAASSVAYPDTTPCMQTRSCDIGALILNGYDDIHRPPVEALLVTIASNGFDCLADDLLIGADAKILMMLLPYCHFRTLGFSQGRSSSALLTASPRIITMPDLVTASHMTLESASCARQASNTASDTRSHSLSGCPSVTDSEAKRNSGIAPICSNNNNNKNNNDSDNNNQTAEAEVEVLRQDVS
eukprot:CAMPEP_0115057966 /NCGR_PEP_ID=MMETSP0227-20121206/6066_1 /TAXON_ID=89957 /ORGANISM="Polarella glacialis, Strain CCMP 1383" /LENGTH=185 /DNA_ID=CAMNT_0002442857 /DNA_START=762 /DNA_END=1320 /DNA_ORIENTATION=-